MELTKKILAELENAKRITEKRNDIIEELTKLWRNAVDYGHISPKYLCYNLETEIGNSAYGGQYYSYITVEDSDRYLYVGTRNYYLHPNSVVDQEATIKFLQGTKEFLSWIYSELEKRNTDMSTAIDYAKEAVANI